MSTALILRDDSALQISFTEAAERIKEEALAVGALIGKVDTPEQNEKAVDALKHLKRVIADTEKARKECKEPILTFGREIDAKAKEFREELDEEYNRLSKLTADFMAAEQARARAAEAAKIADLEKAERERQESLAKAKTIDEANNIQEEFNQRQAQVTAKANQPAKAEGQTARRDWEVTITNMHLLAQQHPQCVTMTPRMSEIKSLLAVGVVVAGVQAKEIIKSGVRLSPQRKAIDVPSSAVAEPVNANNP